MNLISLIAVMLVALPALGEGFRFPSSSASTSPDVKWKLACKSPAGGDGDSSHVLLLTRIGQARDAELRRFDRRCEALWSPDSSHIAITDWLGSNASDVFIYAITNAVSGMSIGGLFPKGAIPEAELRGHCYFEATKWLDRNRLRIRIFGHTDESHAHEFEYSYVFDFSSRHFEKAGNKAPK